MKRSLIVKAVAVIAAVGAIGVLGATTAEAGRGIQGGSYSAGRGI